MWESSNPRTQAVQEIATNVFRYNYYQQSLRKWEKSTVLQNLKRARLLLVGKLLENKALRCVKGTGTERGPTLSNIPFISSPKVEKINYSHSLNLKTNLIQSIYKQVTS